MCALAILLECTTPWPFWVMAIHLGFVLGLAIGHILGTRAR